uniref:Uncharacterized protein n=1 Tax=Arundo donax TaxID=35708 RepID=A0A0A9CFE0_ARUDO
MLTLTRLHHQDLLGQVTLLLPLLIK